MSFLDIKDPPERATPVKEYVTAMKTVKQCNVANRELNLAIGDLKCKLFSIQLSIQLNKRLQLQMGNKLVKISEDGTTLKVDDAECELTLDLHALIMQKHPRPIQWTSSDYQAYKSISAQRKFISHPNSVCAARQHTTWKYKLMLRKIVVPEEKIVEEKSEDSEDTDTASTGDSSVISSPSSTHKA